MHHADGEAHIEDGKIVIAVDLSNLQRIANGAWAAGYTDPIRIPNPEAFAEEMCRALNDESEDGTTAIHRLIDDATVRAFEGGAGEEMTEEEAEEMAASFQNLTERT